MDIGCDTCIHRHHCQSDPEICGTYTMDNPTATVTIACNVAHGMSKFVNHVSANLSDDAKSLTLRVGLCQSLSKAWRAAFLTLVAERTFDMLAEHRVSFHPDINISAIFDVVDKEVIKVLRRLS